MIEILNFIKDLFTGKSEQFSPSFSALVCLIYLVVWGWAAIHFMEGGVDIRIWRRKQ
jgi:hypothetical protein